MDAIVQFVRNGLCCIKDWDLFPDAFLHDPAVTAQYYAFPAPLNKTTPLEICICVTQFYALVTVTLAGIKLVTRSGIGKMRLLHRLVESNRKDEDDDKDEKKKDDDKKKEEKIPVAEVVARRIVTSSLLSEGDAALRSTFIGVCVMAIGGAFFWLTANSLHITETDWIGGLPALIAALVAAEAGLFPLLYLMLRDAAAYLRSSKEMSDLAAELSGGSDGKGKCKPLKIEDLTVEQYGWLAPGGGSGGWSPFWANGSAGSAADVAAEGKLLVEEEAAVAAGLAALSREVGPDVLERLRKRSAEEYAVGCREYLYFILNFIAFYGYMLSVMPYFFEDESARSVHVHSVMLGVTNEYAEWGGNFAGDFMWTIEPLIILGSPMLVLGYAAKAAATKKKSGPVKEKAA